MGALDYLFGQQAPASVNSTVGATNGLPDWYQEYIRGVAGKATQLAGAQSDMEVPAQSVAGFNQDQLDAFGKVRSNQGSWQPDIDAAREAASGIVPGSTSLINQGQEAVAGPAKTWDDAAATKYMSPYTTQVIDNIQRLGLRNLNENLIPAVQDQFIGSGQFGSTRNADILGRTVRDASTDINGQVTNALNSGYTNAQTMFTGDANREQQQQQMQGSAALQGAGLATTAGQTGAQTLGALGEATQAMGATDAGALGSIGTQQQGLQQEGLNTGYTNAVNANNFDWNQLNNVSSLVRGAQLPQTTVQSSNLPSTPANGAYSGSNVAQVGALTSTLSR